MIAKFDPIQSRTMWLKHRLGFVARSDPTAIPVAARAHYAQLQTTRMIDAFLVGLAREVRPSLEGLVAWMERQPEPDCRVFPAVDGKRMLGDWQCTNGVRHGGYAVGCSGKTTAG